MPTKNTPITKQSVVNEFINKVVTPAYNSCVFWDSYNPGSTRINVSALGPRNITRPTTANISGDSVNASSAATIINLVKNFAYNTTVYRRARSGYKSGTSTTTGDRIDVCRLTDNYRIGYGYDEDAFRNIPMDATAAHINNFFDTVRNIARQAQTSATVVDLRVCHSNCHSSCHSSRGRR
jgi:hypothetical protein